MFSEREYSRRYHEQRFIETLTCDERARLLVFLAKYLRIADGTQDVCLDARRVEFARYLVETGRISEGVE